jgi:hypothetical protein
MTDSSKFLRLQELADSMSSKLSHLKSGNLSRTELEKLTDESREFYERLVVLRFMAYADEVKESEVAQDTETQTSVEHEVPVFNFKIEDPKPEVPVQVSLIDAIEEVTKSETTNSDAEIESEEIMSPAPVQQNFTEQAPSLNELISVQAHKESLHEKLSKELNQPESLAQKLEHNPIPDLKRAITLNQRFQFSKELFKGNNQDYEVAIDKLNSSTRDEAMKHLESLRSKYAWNSDSSVAHDFVDLVERRHL